MEHSDRTLQNYLNGENYHSKRTLKKGQKCNAQLDLICFRPRTDHLIDNPYVKMVHMDHPTIM